MSRNIKITAIKKYNITNCECDPKIVKKYILSNPIEGDTLEKVLINAKSCNTFADILLLMASAIFIYLEGPSGRTTQMLYDMGIPLDNLRPISIDKINNKYLKDKSFSSYQCHFYTAIMKHIPKKDLKNVGAIWLDYNSTILGNTKDPTRPYQDVEILLKKINHDFTFMITFSIRSRHTRNKFKGLFENEDDDETTDVEDKKKKKRSGFNLIDQIHILKKIIINYGYSYDQDTDYNGYSNYGKSMAYWKVNLKKT